MKDIHKAIFVCGLGSALEWYDFSLFGVLAPIIAGVFFPSGNQWTSLLLVFVTFASGFVMRPIGAIYFGRMGDKFGRKAALAATIILMAFSTSLIGLIPSYASIGFLSPLLVVSMRLIQGFSASGEYPNAISLMTELSPDAKRGYYGSFSVFGVVAGIFLSSLVVFLLTQGFSKVVIDAWAWRIPFLISAPLGLLGFYLRFKMNESPVFLALKKNNELAVSPILDAIQSQFKQTLIVFCLFAFSTVGFYTVFIYINAYLTHLQAIPLKVLSLINVINIAVLLCLIPVFGRLSDIVDRKKLMMFGIISIAIFAYPIFSLLVQSSMRGLILGQLGFAVLLSIVVGPMAAFTAELMPSQLRTSGISLGLNLSASLLGGTAPLFAAYLVRVLHTPMAPCYYLMGCAVVALLALVVGAETVLHPLYCHPEHSEGSPA
ncbi:MAG: MFS transporter [Gammaproteobacteria bacterium]